MPVEQPRLRLTISGLAVPGVTSLEVDCLGCFSADRFRVAFAIGADPLLTMAYFAGLQAETMVIEAALAPGGFVTLLTGQIDNVRVDLLAGVATLSGRDLSARLIDSEIAEGFVNRTASQIAQTIALRRGLLPNVTATAMTVGQYYEINHTRHGLGVNARATTEWNLLIWLAQLEGFDLSVTGMTLNFGVSAPGAPVSLDVRDFVELELDMATTLPSRAIVKSWNSRSKMAVMQMAGDEMGGSTTLVRPNLTATQAQAAAGAHLAALGRHGTVLVGTMPGELTLMPGMEIVLGGTFSQYDQAYRVDAVRRQIDARRGFRQTIRAYASTN